MHRQTLRGLVPIYIPGTYTTYTGMTWYRYDLWLIWDRGCLYRGCAVIFEIPGKGTLVSSCCPPTPRHAIYWTWEHLCLHGTCTRTPSSAVTKWRNLMYDCCCPVAATFSRASGTVYSDMVQQQAAAKQSKILKYKLMGVSTVLLGCGWTERLLAIHFRILTLNAQRVLHGARPGGAPLCTREPLACPTRLRTCPVRYGHG